MKLCPVAGLWGFTPLSPLARCRAYLKLKGELKGEIMKITITTELSPAEVRAAITEYILAKHRYNYSHPLHDGIVEEMQMQESNGAYRVVWGEPPPEKEIAPPSASPEAMAQLIQECDEQKAEAV